MTPPIAARVRRVRPPFVGARVLLVGALLGSASGSARADDGAAADALFQQAKSLTEQKRWAEACPKFEASYKLDKTLGTLLNLADCEEHVTRLASAWAHWGEAVELAQRTGDKRADFAVGHRAALTPRLPMIRIDASPEKTTLEVYRDGVKIDAAAYTVPLPSDPGKHVITARRGAETLATRDVVAREADTVVVALDLAAIEKAAPPPAPPAGAPQSSYRTAGFVVGGLGVATVAVAGGLEIAALVAKASAGAPGACVNNLCTPTGIDAINRARTLATGGQWVGIGGILVSAVGLTLVLTAPRAPRAPVTVTGWASPGAAGLTLGGAL